MAESRKSSIVVLCSIVGCLVTVLACGVMVGRVQANVTNTNNSLLITQENVEYLRQGQAEVKQKQAFLEGQVSAKLDAISSSVIKIEKQVDDLIRSD